MAEKQLKKFLRDAVTIIVGKQFEKISDLLNSKKHVNEFLIAKKMDLTINQTRNLLYRISDQGIVSSIRKKDKRKGWYTYFWKIEPIKALEFLKNSLISTANQLYTKLRSREEKQFFLCAGCKVEVNEETALIRNFTCTECGNVYSIKDNEPIIREIKKSIVKIEKEVEEINLEIGKENEKFEKIKERKKEMKEKAKKSSKKAKVKMKKDRGVKKRMSKKTGPVKKKTKKTKKAKVKKTKKGGKAKKTKKAKVKKTKKSSKKK